MLPNNFFSALAVILWVSLRSTSAKLLGTSFGVPGNATYDYVIVGGGTAGLTIASRLASFYTVAVVEAGSFYEIGNGNLSEIPLYDARFTAKSPSDVNPLIDWGFVTTPQKALLNASIHYARGKTLGGCSARNYMAYHRGTNGSYEKWAEQVGDSSYLMENFSTYFAKSVHYTPANMVHRAKNATPDLTTEDLASGGPLSITFSNFGQPSSSWIQRAFAAIGVAPRAGFTNGGLLGSSYVLDTINATTQTRDSSETSFLRSSLAGNNLTIYTSSLAKKINFVNGTAANSVHVETASSSYELTASCEVILSAGAFQSPQLLMVSGVGPQETLTEHNIPIVLDRQGVGQNMWDHIFMGISVRMNLLTASSLKNPEIANRMNEEFLSNGSGILTNPGGDFLGFERAPTDLVSNQVLESLSMFPDDWPALEYMSMSGYLGLQNDYSDAPDNDYNYATLSANVVAPQSRGSISIRSSDMADPPLIDPGWMSHPSDEALMLAGFKRVRQLFATDVIQPILIGGEAFPGPNITTDQEILDVIRRSISTVFHAAATCAMGRTDDPKAVVDARARVIGARNLRVVDASAFPLLPPGHPMATVYALAEKIAADILA